MPSFQPIAFGKYTLLERIGVNAMAELYRASRLGKDNKPEPLLIKRFLPQVNKNPKLIESISHSAKISSRFQHDNIAATLDFGSTDGIFYIATAYLSGYPLRYLLEVSRERERPFCPQHALHIAVQICQALVYAHEFKDPSGEYADPIHGNLSPDTAFVTLDGLVKLTDFGIHRGTHHEKGGQLDPMNTWLAYTSPEQLSADPSSDARSDIFSLGVLLYEMLTGQRMFHGKSMEIFSKVRHAIFDPIDKIAPHVPLELHNLVTQSVQKAPKKRYASAAEMLKALEKARSGLPQPTFDRGLSDYFTARQKGQQKGEMNAPALDLPPAAPTPSEESKPSLSPAHQAVSEALTPESQPAGPEESADQPVITGEICHTVDRQETSKPAKRTWKPTKPMAWLVGLPAVLAVIIAISLVFNGSAQRGDHTPPPTPAEEAIEALDRGDFRQAVSRFEQALDARPENRSRLSRPYAQALKGRASQLITENPTKAEKCLLAAKELDPKWGPIYSTLGLLYLNRKDYPKAIEAYQEAIRLTSGTADTFFNLGYIYAVRQNYSKAREMYTRTVELAPPFLDEALFNLAVIEDRLGKHKESIKNLQRALEYNPENQQVRVYLNRLNT